MKQVEYVIGDDILEVFQKTLYDGYIGKVDFLGPDPKQKVTVKTGLAGIRQISRAIQDMAVRSGLVINASDVKDIGKVSDNDGLECMSYTIPFLATVRFYLDPSMDPVDADTDNSYINGYRKSSYAYRLAPETGDEVEIVATGIREPAGSVKYYWVNYLVNGNSDKTYEQRVTDKHPFYCQQNYKVTNNPYTTWYSLADWKEITKQEYELYNKLHS